MLYWRALSQHKKGIHGIGILFIFIALMLIAVSVSGFVIYKSNQMAQDGQMTYDRISENFKHFRVVEVAGYDGRDQAITSITIDAKLMGDSTPMDLRSMSLSIGEKDFRTVLKYRGYGAPAEESNQGYLTWQVQEFDELVAGTNYFIHTDLDDDGADDYIRLNSTHVIFNISSNSTEISYPLGTDISAPTIIDFDESITDGRRYGNLVIQGMTTLPNTIDADMTFEFTPYYSGSGYYVSEHLIRSERSRNGYMVPGDVVRFHLETYGSVDMDDIIDIKVMYNDLEASGKRVYVGNTFPNTERVILWPKP